MSAVAATDGKICNTNGTTHHEGTLKGGAELGRAVSVQLTAEQFEELYLQPARVSREAAVNINRFANPTALGILGFVITLTPTTWCLMGFGHGTPSTLTTLTGLYYLFGGLQLWVSALLEWVLGNTFTFIVFASFGSFWFVLATEVQPEMGLAAALGGAATPGYNDTYALYLIGFGFWCLLITVCALRTNVVFVIILSAVTIGDFVLAAGYFAVSPHPNRVDGLFKASGGILFVCALGGWYFLTFLLLQSVNFPITLPVGDLSRLIKPKKN